jgi:hypothetical protein
MVLLIASAVSGWLAWQAIRAQRSAREEAATAQAVQGFLVQQLLGRTSPWVLSENDPTNRIMVERIARAVEGKFTNQPRVEADIRYALGRAMNDGYEDFPAALVQYQQAYDLRKRHLGLGHSDTLASAAALGLALHEAGRHREAESLLDDAIMAARKSATRHSLGAFEVLRARGTRLVYEGQSADAVPYLTEALDISRRTEGADPVLVTSTQGLHGIRGPQGG